MLYCTHWSSNRFSPIEYIALHKNGHERKITSFEVGQAGSIKRFLPLLIVQKKKKDVYGLSRYLQSYFLLLNTHPVICRIVALPEGHPWTVNPAELPWLSSPKRHDKQLN